MGRTIDAELKGEPLVEEPGHGNTDPVESSIDPRVVVALLTHVDETVIVLDDAGRVVLASPAIRSLLGYDPASMTGRSMVEFLHPDEVDELIESFDRWGRPLRHSAGQIQRLRAANGDWVPVYYDAVVGEPAEPLGEMVITMRSPDRADPGRSMLLQRLMNEDRLVRLASTFLHVGIDQFDEGLDQAVAELAGLEWVTRVSVWTTEGDRAWRRGVWTSWPETRQPSGALRPSLRHQGSHILRRLVAGEEVHLNSVRHLPDDWAMERDALMGAHVESLLADPMVHGGTFAGFVMIEVTLQPISFDATHLWTLRSAAANPRRGDRPSRDGARTRPPRPDRPVDGSTEPLGVPGTAGRRPRRCHRGSLAGCGCSAGRSRPVQGDQRRRGSPGR